MKAFKYPTMLASLSLCLFLTQIDNVIAQDTIKIVTTLSSYSDIARTVGGNRVEASYIASSRFNPHFIEPRPSDVLKLKKADLFIHSGLDLEAWRAPLLDAAAKSDIRDGGKRQLDLSENIALLEVPYGQVSRSEGDIHMFGNPHYWIDPRNGIIIAKNIASKLIEIDPKEERYYSLNLVGFLNSLNEKIIVWREMLKPYIGNEILGYHREWPYLMSFAGLGMTRFVEPKPGIPPGPQHLSELENYIKANGIRLMIQSSYSSSDAGEYLSKKTGIKVKTICQNVGEVPECKDYIAMVDFIISEIVKGLAHE